MLKLAEAKASTSGAKAAACAELARQAEASGGKFSAPAGVVLPFGTMDAALQVSLVMCWTLELQSQWSMRSACQSGAPIWNHACRSAFHKFPSRPLMSAWIAAESSASKSAVLRDHDTLLSRYSHNVLETGLLRANGLVCTPLVNSAQSCQACHLWHSLLSSPSLQCYGLETFPQQLSTESGN